MSQSAVYVGIDVAQAELVVAVRAPDAPEPGWTVPNDPAGLAPQRGDASRVIRHGPGRRRGVRSIRRTHGDEEGGLGHVDSDILRGLRHAHLLRGLLNTRHFSGRG